MYAIPINGQGQYVNQPIPVFFMQPVSQTPAKKTPLTYERMPTKTLQWCSILNILICNVSVGLQIMQIYNSDKPFSTYIDYTYHGLWCGSLYMIAGLLGFPASYKKTKSKVVLALIFSLIAFFAGIGSAVLAGFTDYTYLAFVQTDYVEFRIWNELKWASIGIGALAAVNNFLLVIVTSVTLHREPRSVISQNTNQQVLVPATNAAFSPSAPVLTNPHQQYLTSGTVQSSSS